MFRNASVEIGKLGRRRVELALEINFALWIMVACLAVEATNLIQYLS